MHQVNSLNVNAYFRQGSLTGGEDALWRRNENYDSELFPGKYKSSNLYQTLKILKSVMYLLLFLTSSGPL